MCDELKTVLDIATAVGTVAAAGYAGYAARLARLSLDEVTEAKLIVSCIKVGAGLERAIVITNSGKVAAKNVSMTFRRIPTLNKPRALFGHELDKEIEVGDIGGGSQAFVSLWTANPHRGDTTAMAELKWGTDKKAQLLAKVIVRYE